MLAWRVFLSCLLIPALIAVFYVDARAGNAAPLLFLFCVLLAIRGCWELSELLRTRSLNPNFRVTMPIVVLLLAAAWAPHVFHESIWPENAGRLLGLVGLLYALCMLLLFARQAAVFRESGDSMESLGRALLRTSLAAAAATVIVMSALPWSPSLPATRIETGALATMSVVYALSTVVLLIPELSGRTDRDGNRISAGTNVLIVSYVGLLLAVTAQLRWVAGPQAGYFAIGSLVVTTKMGDVAAYTTGRLFGRKKMAPLLSPGKTWAGAYGAVLGAGLAASAWFHWAPRWFDASWQGPGWQWGLVYGVVIGATGLVGDLCESLIKRDVGRKDAASLMPGFGGLLDLLDSVIYAGPCAYAMWLIWRLAATV